MFEVSLITALEWAVGIAFTVAVILLILAAWLFFREEQGSTVLALVWSAGASAGGGLLSLEMWPGTPILPRPSFS